MKNFKAGHYKNKEADKNFPIDRDEMNSYVIPLIKLFYLNSNAKKVEIEQKIVGEIKGTFKITIEQLNSK